MTQRMSFSRRLRTWAVTICVFGVLGIVCGSIAGERRWYQSRFMSQSHELELTIENDPDLSLLRIRQSSDGFAYLVGEVPTKEVLDHAQQLLVGVGGMDYAYRWIVYVSVTANTP